MPKALGLDDQWNLNLYHVPCRRKYLNLTIIPIMVILWYYNERIYGLALSSSLHIRSTFFLSSEKWLVSADNRENASLISRDFDLGTVLTSAIVYSGWMSRANSGRRSCRRFSVALGIRINGRKTWESANIELTLNPNRMPSISFISRDSLPTATSQKQIDRPPSSIFAVVQVTRKKTRQLSRVIRRGRLFKVRLK